MGKNDSILKKNYIITYKSAIFLCMLHFISFCRFLVLYILNYNDEELFILFGMFEII